MFFRQRWNDSRLCYLPVRGKPTDQRLILSPEISKHVWKPNIYFRNSKEARFHLVPTQNVLFGVTPDGCILMNSQTEDDVIVKWGAGNRGVIVSNYLEIPQFDISKVVVRNRNSSYNTGVFSEPQATFVFKRRVMFYVYGFYLPVVLVVLLSWISFWIDPESTPARVSLGVITILAMGNFLHGGGATPNVSYATALDVYMITCFVFVFACLLEYAAVHCALNKSQKAEINEGMENESVSSASTIPLPMTSNENEVTSALRRKSLVIETKLRYIQFNSTSLESYSRVAFPLCFLIFNVAYWL
ncbi:Glycine receptor subunit alphaZ1, partial [Acropora cervicornis]